VPTKKQIDYALVLLDRAGYGTRYMDARFKELGVTMRERSGSVTDWLRGMTGPECSRLIDTLEAKTAKT
jgi:hypothetical protein